jgi:hypothetical protein
MDLAIFGGGCGGLWLLHEAASRGYKGGLLEDSDSLGRFAMTRGRNRLHRIVAVSLALILLAPGCPHAAEVGPPSSCPRPADQYGPRYQIMTGAYQSRGNEPWGGQYVTIMRDKSPISVPVSGDVFNAAGNLRPGTRVTLVGYVSDSMSGAMPPYSCIELAP